MYQVRACGFEAELTAGEGEGLSVGADVFDGSKVDRVRLRNAHVASMTFINNYCKGMTFEIVQRSEAPKDTWRREQERYFVYRTRFKDGMSSRSI